MATATGDGQTANLRPLAFALQVFCNLLRGFIMVSQSIRVEPVDISIDGTMRCDVLSKVCGTVGVSGSVGGGVSVIVGHPKLFKAAVTLQGDISGGGTF